MQMAVDIKRRTYSNSRWLKLPDEHSFAGTDLVSAESSMYSQFPRKLFGVTGESLRNDKQSPETDRADETECLVGDSPGISLDYLSAKRRCHQSPKNNE